jgi:hypothetical protein
MFYICIIVVDLIFIDFRFYLFHHEIQQTGKIQMFGEYHRWKHI